MKDDILKLDNQLCFALYACSREVIKRYKPFLDPLGITYTQYITLLVLWETPAISFKLLAERLMLDSGTLTPLIKKLESSGLLTKQRDPEDERSVLIELTEKGLSLKEEALKIPEKVILRTGMTLQEMVVLKDQLQLAIEHLKVEESQRNDKSSQKTAE